MRRLATTLILALVSIPATPAMAHGTFVDARPLPGVEVGGVVDEVALLFPEELHPGAGSMTLLGPGGAVALSGDVEYPADTVIRLPIDPLTQPGTDEVAFTVPAVDGFVFEGSCEFDYSLDASPLEPLPYGRGDGSLWLIVGGVFGVGGGFLLVRMMRSKGRLNGRIGRVPQDEKESR